MDSRRVESGSAALERGSPQEYVASLQRNLLHYYNMAHWLDTFPQPEEKIKSILAKIPLEKRMTTAEKVAAMVVFILSARASHITASTFSWTAGTYTSIGG